MRLTNLADVCRTSGLSVTTHSGWQSRDYGGYGMRSAKGVLCHWTGSPTSPGNPTAGLSIVRDGRSDLPGPLAHLFLDYNGGVHVLAAGWCNHAGTGSGQGLAGNPDCIGIECGNAGVFSTAQSNAYPRLVAALQRGYSMEPRCALSHQEWAPRRKVDIHSWPGGMGAFRATVAAHISNPNNAGGAMAGYADWDQASRDKFWADMQFTTGSADGPMRDAHQAVGQIRDTVNALPNTILTTPVNKPGGGTTNLYSVAAWSDYHIDATRQIIRDAAASVTEQVKSADSGEAAAAAVVAAIDHRLAGLSVTLTTLGA